MTIFQPALRADIILSTPSPFGTDYAQILATNCTDTNFSYVLQGSTNLQDWSSVVTNPVTTAYLPFVFPAPAPPSFYRVATVPRVLVPKFSMAIVCRSNLNINGKNMWVDSFDSGDTNYSSTATASPSNNVVWVYDSAKAKSGGDIGVNGGAVGGANFNTTTIFGHLYTGPGSQATNVQIGPNGMIGDFSWYGAHVGIESNGTPQSWWLPNFNVNLPDVPAPTFIGLALPPTMGGYVILSGGNYLTSGSTLGNLLVIAPSTLWVKNSCSLGVTIGPNGSLVLYVGHATGGGDNISLAGNGTMNQPGYARNLQIYGLPGLTGIDMHGNADWTACIYAPNASFTAGGGGTNTQTASGSIAVKSISLNGHWRFHYDESLKVIGPAR